MRLIRADLHQSLQPGDRLHNPTVEQMSEINRALGALADAHGIRLINPLQRLCKDDNCLIALPFEGTVELTASDYGHLTPPAARHVLAPFMSRFTPAQSLSTVTTGSAQASM